MNDDIMVFAPGDKVMRVANNRGGTRVWKNSSQPPKFGVVYCVNGFCRGPRFNVITLVGFGGWRYSGRIKVGYYAGAFRKVEEIQLCVKAAQYAVRKQKEPQTA